ncbi:cysteine and histidine-rich domain-containing protein morgana [Anabrus simplex]|uniref:cysteine and histidine-rich domain-containing protein morgana n=1 Tax=Anabrus simplex TaxID=316456 RepID=UPI0034DDB90B
MTMPSGGTNLLRCYNRGCGQTYDPESNGKDSCTFHPGAPFFHDAYKGWSCCKKKCTDFTEFLNIKGCTKSFHSNEKPPEPEKPVVDKSKADEVIEYKAPEPTPKALTRPSFDTPLTELKPEIAPGLSQQAESLQKADDCIAQDSSVSTAIPVGTSCKNNGCKEVYESEDSLHGTCTHHPGFPVFHEGLKFWSCCQRRTTDFNSFLEQAGCSSGSHVWIKQKHGGDQQVNCRYDWHQTATNVVVSVFAKKYDPRLSSVSLSPVRLKVHLFFPEEGGSFNLDLELRGIIDVARSNASMLPAKLEVKMRKAEPGSWSKLDFPRPVQQKAPEPEVEEKLTPSINAVDLNDSVDLSDL